MQEVMYGAREKAGLKRQSSIGSSTNGPSDLQHRSSDKRGLAQGDFPSSIISLIKVHILCVRIIVLLAQPTTTTKHYGWPCHPRMMLVRRRKLLESRMESVKRCATMCMIRGSLCIMKTQRGNLLR
ncbi:b3362757-df36-486c-97dd-ae2b65c2df5a [Sclerotinia trifoliorum]|uniref:B3362757-df36-486c-97dd-ae2b65c2df5a n=1 Tax=Sclerotinia trifoliorum TaxID=28548 RepID=A0A8H2VQN9_9HELO|nr:b3362757-df36-486c-97dd-ae2b65c2df5a [Sclerotinia trifoliorum]